MTETIVPKILSAVYKSSDIADDFILSVWYDENKP